MIPSWFFNGVGTEKKINNFEPKNSEKEFIKMSQKSYILSRVVKVRNMKMDFNTGGTWHRVKQ